MLSFATAADVGLAVLPIEGSYKTPGETFQVTKEMLQNEKIPFLLVFCVGSAEERHIFSEQFVW